MRVLIFLNILMLGILVLNIFLSIIENNIPAICGWSLALIYYCIILKDDL